MTSKRFSRRKLLREVGAGAALGSLGLLGACAELGIGPAAKPGQEPIASNPLNTLPWNQAPTFRNIDRLAPTRAIARGQEALPLPAHRLELASLRYAYEQQTYTLDEYMRRNRTTGLLVLKGGAIAL